MEGYLRLKYWLSYYLFLTLVSVSAAGERAAPQPPGQVGPKLPVLLTYEPANADPKDDEMRKLLKARYNLVVSQMQRVYRSWQLGLSGIEDVTELAQQLAKSGLELRDEPAEKIRFLSQFVELMKEAEKTAEAELNSGIGTTSSHDLYRVRYLRLDAEIDLLRTKREVAEAKD